MQAEAISTASAPMSPMLGDGRLGERELVDHWIRETWTALAASLDAIEPSTVLFVVTGGHNLDSVETAYLPPNAHEPDYDVLRRIGEQRLHEYNGLHRVAIFKVVREGQLGGFASMLRHELRHVEQFHRYGPGLFELPWMGHANVNTTRRYLHHKARKDDAKILDSAFALDSPPSESGDDPDDDVVARLQRQVAEMAETLAAMKARA